MAVIQGLHDLPAFCPECEIRHVWSELRPGRTAFMSSIPTSRCVSWKGHSLSGPLSPSLQNEDDDDDDNDDDDHEEDDGGAHGTCLTRRP